MYGAARSGGCTGAICPGSSNIDRVTTNGFVYGASEGVYTGATVGNSVTKENLHVGIFAGFDALVAFFRQYGDKVGTELTEKKVAFLSLCIAVEQYVTGAGGTDFGVGNGADLYYK